MAIDIEVEILHRLQGLNLPTMMPLDFSSRDSFDQFISGISRTLFEPENFTEQNKRAFLLYLLKAEHWQMFFKMLDQCFSVEGNYPWDLFLEGIFRSHIKLSEFEIDTISKGIGFKGSQRLACNSMKGVREILGAEDWMFQARFDVDRLASKRKAEGLDLLETLRSQNMIQKEKITIDELRGRFPNDPEIAAIQVQFQQRFAFELLDSKLRHRRRLNPEFREVQSEADLDAIAFWCQECRPLARLDQQSAADLAMMFYFMEEYPVALVILREAGDVRNANDPSRIWFEAEILLQSKLYLELLALLEWIETHLFEDGETTFAVMYLRAKALRGLGQKHHAIEMLEALVSARPDYRSAQWILNDWRDS